MPTSIGSLKKQESSRKTSTSVSLTKASDYGNHNKLWKILKDMGIPDFLTFFLRNWMQVKKQQLEKDMEQQTGFKLRKECIKGVYYHPAYLTSIKSIS